MEKPWTKFYDSGVPEDVPYPEGTLVHHILENAAERFPNRPATIFPTKLGQSLSEGRISYRDLDRLANRFANGLASLGIQMGDRVALILPNCPQFLIALFGTLKAGAIVVPFDLRYAPDLIERQLLDCGAETVVTMNQNYPQVKQVQPNTLVTRVIVTQIKDYFPTTARLFGGLGYDAPGSRVSADPRDYSFRQVLRRSGEAPPETAIDPADVALLQYEGGSADTPYGAMLSHRNLVCNCLYNAAWRTDAEEGHEVALCLVPFYRPSGIQIALLSNVYLSSALILFPEFKIEDVLAGIEKYRPSVFPGLPEIYGQVLNYPAIRKHDLHSIRTSFCSEGQLSPEVQEEWEERTGGRLVGGYGRAEAGPHTLCNPVHGERRRRSMGIPLPGTIARIIGPEGSKVNVAAGNVGRLALQGQQVFSGYWNHPDETAKRLHDGWLVTGDYAHEDQDGFFYLVEPKTPTAEATNATEDNVRR